MSEFEDIYRNEQIHDLARFVLKECGDIKYFLDISKYHSHDIRKFSLAGFGIKIEIREKTSTIFEYLSMLDELLEKQFGVHIDDLDITGKELTEIPDEFLQKLPLRHLCVHSNKLDKLPKLPNTLISLHCSYNNLTELPTLPKTLIKLFCFGNELTELPELPESLKELSCTNNLISEPPKLPKDIAIVNCGNNPFWTEEWKNKIDMYIYKRKNK